MGLFSGKKKRESIALIDVGSASVGGAFVHFEPNTPPTIYFTARVPIELRAEESTSDAMLRSLKMLTQVLVEHGAPALRREAGSAHIDHILVSVAAPWQQTQVSTIIKQEQHPFLVTQALMHDLVTKNTELTEGRVRTNQSVIATILNGYEIGNPFGKRATRAELVLLSSSLEKDTAAHIEHTLRRGFHTHTTEMVAFAPLAYAVFRDLYPHEKDYLIFDVTGDATDIVFVKRGILAEVASVAQGTNDLKQAAREASLVRIPVHEEGMPIAVAVKPDTSPTFTAKLSEVEKMWVENLTKTLKEFSNRHALPRTVFLLADLDSREFLHQLLDNPTLHSLWLSDDPLSVIPVSPKHLAQYIRTRGEAEGDVFLSMLALYFNKRLVATPIKDIPKAKSVIPTKKA